MNDILSGTYDLDPKKITTEELGLYMAGAKRSVKNED